MYAQQKQTRDFLRDRGAHLVVLSVINQFKKPFEGQLSKRKLPFSSLLHGQHF